MEGIVLTSENLLAHVICGYKLFVRVATCRFIVDWKTYLPLLEDDLFLINPSQLSLMHSWSFFGGVFFSSWDNWKQLDLKVELKKKNREKRWLSTEQNHATAKHSLRCTTWIWNHQKSRRAWMEQLRNRHSILRDTVLLGLGLVQHWPLGYTNS